jgi:Ca2+-binding EF-hand superfamily protein
MLRSQLSQSSTAEEIVDEPSGITFEQFEKILALARTKQPTEELLINALKPLEDQKIHDDGEIVHVLYADALREYLQEFGDVLSDDEMKEFLDEFCPGKKTEETSILVSDDFSDAADEFTREHAAVFALHLPLVAKLGGGVGDF